MDKPLISVVMPVWNRKNELIRALNSIKNQDYEPIEIIVIDNHSTDGTREYFKGLKDGVKCIYLNENKESSIPRNIGIKESLGKYILFMDSDAILHKKDTLSKSVELMESDKKIGAISMVVYSDKEEYEIYTAGTYLDWNGYTSEKAHLPLKKRVFDIDYVSSCISFNRKEALEDIGGFDPYFPFTSEDVDLGIRMKRAGWKLVVDPSITGLHLKAGKGRIVTFLSFKGIKAKNRLILKDFTNRQIGTYYKRTVGDILRNLIKLLLIYEWPMARFRRNKKDFLEKTNYGTHQSKLTSFYLKMPKSLKGIYLSIAGKYISDKVKRRKLPGSWFLFVTNRCNSMCKHCFYWKELNTERDEITLEQYEKMIVSAKGKIDSVNLTGGEPFMRRDLADICKLFSKKSNVKQITLATNGLMSDYIKKEVENMLSSIRKNITLHIALSLEGPEKLNDEIRGVKGGYRKTLETIKLLKQLREKHSNLELSITTTVSKFNIDKIEGFADNLRKELGVYHKFILIRSAGDSVFGCPPNAISSFTPPSKYTLLPSIKDLENLYLRLVSKGHLQGRHKTIFRIGIETLKRKSALMPCLVGKLDLIVYPNGDIAFCELINPFDNLRRVNFNLNKIWNSKKANNLRKNLKNCACTHSCNIGSNLTCNLKERINEELKK